MLLSFIFQPKRDVTPMPFRPGSGESNTIKVYYLYTVLETETVIKRVVQRLGNIAQLCHFYSFLTYARFRP